MQHLNDELTKLVHSVEIEKFLQNGPTTWSSPQEMQDLISPQDKGWKVQVHFFLIFVPQPTQHFFSSTRIPAGLEFSAELELPAELEFPVFLIISIIRPGKNYSGFVKAGL